MLALELTATRSKPCLKSHKGTQSRSKGRVPSQYYEKENERKKFLLDYSIGGHTAAVSCGIFDVWGERKVHNIGVE